MDLKQQFQKLKEQFQELLIAIQSYFRQLNQLEQYGWAAIGVGFLLVISGIVLL